MNHRQFEEWLLSEEPLGGEQERSLQMHLATCPACASIAQGWREVNAVLRQTDTPASEAGFTQRWEQRLAEEEYRQRSWRGWLILGMVTAVGVTLILRPGGALLPSLGDMLDWVSEATASILAIFRGIQTVTDTFFNFFPSTTPVMWLAMFNLGAVAIITMWLIAMKQLAFSKEY